MLDFSHISVVPDLNIFPGGCEYAGKTSKLTPVQGTFLSILERNHPKATASLDLMGKMYVGLDWPQEKILHAYACNINRRLSGVAIKNVWGYGYRLEYDVHS